MMLSLKRRTKTLVIVVFALAAALATQVASADIVPTIVIVGNDAPSFSVSPFENPASDGTSPTAAGDQIAFEATATDAGGDNYYLAVCRTNAVTPNNGAAPTCDGGAFCISTATSPATPTSCLYTTSGADPENLVWYAFVCDGNVVSANCSSSDQGAGASGSPFKVNHAPGFTAASSTPAADPGGVITFSTTASDSDTDTAADTVFLLVCRTAGVTGAACDGGLGDTWCSSGNVASNPSCQLNLNLVEPAGTFDAFFYVFDSHDMPSSSLQQGSNNQFSVNNTPPVVSNVLLNGGADISLTEGTTTPVVISATVADSNSCQDVNTVTAAAYRSGVTAAACSLGGDANANQCYTLITCSVTGASCGGAADATADYVCTVNLQYHADPTDNNTQYPGENWLSSVTANDGVNNASTESLAGVELNSLVGFTVTSSINYGIVNIGQSNDPLNRVVTVSSTGNVGIDVEFNGTNMLSGANILGVNNQRYALAASTAYAAGAQLTTTPTESELNVPKTTITAASANRNTWWGILIPNGTQPGTYTGTNTVSAIKGEVVGW